MYLKPDDHELEYLSELLDEFPIDDSLNPADALRLVYDRYHALERNFRHLALASKGKIQITSSNPDHFYYDLCSAIHAFLYHGILSNAGSFRDSKDLNFGIVEFGGLTASGHKSRFRGASPPHIESELKTCFEVLNQNDPISASIFFYLEFSYIHPFYDANGRIARLIVSLYLHNHGYHVDWRGIDETHAKFIKRLNDCHSRREWVDRYNEYKGYLLKYWKKYVEPIDSFFKED